MTHITKVSTHIVDETGETILEIDVLIHMNDNTFYYNNKTGEEFLILDSSLHLGSDGSICKHYNSKRQ